ncbi:cysteine hydrolase family protein [Hydromonas duriensis]|uniref:Nicotinamidase-related amidase n=1 Tax=Hydromonas duriensis TaxID=1527608 RepID=A0A4R6YB31_9BURK|nr:cysteine hydrolase family protein [Hydromonas duriensis]TDR32780.1 nicotinamidase-related amidase [Hydromonas duriensis]
MYPALIIIDMQKGIHSPKLGQRNNPEAESNIHSLLLAWRATQAPIVHARHISRFSDSVFWPNQEGVEFQDDFLPLSHEQIFEKNVPDAFAHSGLERWLHVRGIESLIITGVVTNNSVEATARSAGNLGFNCHVVGDGTFTFDKTDYNGILRSADEVHAMSLANLDGEYATIIKTREALNFLTP